MSDATITEQVDLVVDEQLAVDASAVQPAANTPRERSVKARVLVDCELGRPNDVVELTTSAAKAAERIGLIDTDKAAVAYAASLVRV